MGIRLPHQEIDATLPDGWACLLGDALNPERRSKEGLSVVNGVRKMMKKPPSGGNTTGSYITGKELGGYLGMLRREIKEGDDAVRAEMNARFDRVERRLDQIARALKIDGDP